MDVLGALKYFRKKKKIAQKDVLPKKGKQTYWRIEIGEAKLSYEDLMTALQSLGITFNEFFFYGIWYENHGFFRSQTSNWMLSNGVEQYKWKKESDSLFLSIRAQSS